MIVKGSVIVSYFVQLPITLAISAKAMLIYLAVENIVKARWRFSLHQSKGDSHCSHIATFQGFAAQVGVLC
jgi:hypothetical protein